MAQKAFRQGGHGLAQAVGIEHQQHGQAQQGRQLGRAAGASSAAVVEAHGPLHQQNIRGPAVHSGGPHAGKDPGQPLGDAAQRLSRAVRPGRAAHPDVQVGGGRAGQRGVKGGVDEVRAGLGGMDPQAPGLQGAEQGQGGDGFTGVAAGSAHDEAGNAVRGGADHARALTAGRTRLEQIAFKNRHSRS